jgi:tetratricopeptide (TPR) repeat protein
MESLAWVLFRNTSILAIFLAAAGNFLWTCAYFSGRKSAMKPVAVTIFFVTVSAIMWLQGRAALIGFLAAPTVFYVCTVKPGIKKCIGVFIAFAFITIALVFWKPGSSGGRLLIYKVSGQIFADHYLWGIGAGQFKRTYNLYQSCYFQEHPGKEQEVLLADNTFFAFNDPWQLLIEQGSVRSGCALLLLGVLLKKIRSLSKSFGQRWLLAGCFSGGFTILVASLFSYPLQVPSIQVLFYGYAGVTGLLLLQHRVHNIWIRGGMAVALFLPVALCISTITNAVRSNYALQRGFYELRIGYRDRALESLKEAIEHDINDLNAGMALATELFARNKADSALLLVNRFKLMYSENTLYLLSGDIRNARKEFDLAEGDYLVAVYMVPNRLRSRLRLFRFYLEQNRFPEAKSWGWWILRQKPKVPSAEAQAIKKEVALLMEKWNLV